ncbi:urea carboxylase [Flavobacterium sp. 7A]|uniref:urea carboxylase n=1 Tax=Flavobacterium sp. 7A TaxID=2940571 RepID=UPI002227646F|nr:urea carboxylase [Flavobacterium sp. 7A]MCW2119324.1 urea carboxylase [Flavobacterium sp. 7A]
MLNQVTFPQFHTVLIANRGEIAVRIAQTLKKMGIKSVAVYSEADSFSNHVTAADEAICIGGNSASESYLLGDKIIEAAKQSGAQAIIPGYGFLSENLVFAEKCKNEGIAFVGPTPDQIRDFGLKHTSREIAAKAGVPLTPGTGLLKDLEEAVVAALTIGYPIMLKSTAGGGGIGLIRCNNEVELIKAFESVRRLGENFFSDSGVFIERFVDNARHVEVQIFGDGKGNVLALGERDCSLQRRNQKVVEETPAPNLPEATRTKLLESAIKLGKKVNYLSAGTVEYIYDPAHDEFYFLEVNTRLQVEHPITEMVTGVDLVQWMILAACNQWEIPTKTIEPKGASIEVRVYAEDPIRDFQPSPGVLTEVNFPDNVRVDTWVETGTEVSPYYDPMIAKLIVFGENREDAILKLKQALEATSLAGIATNLDYLRKIITSDFFEKAEVSTGKLATFKYVPPVIEVLQPGTYSTVQDYPGRIGYWDIGVPPSGPMDHFGFRLANRIVGNHPTAAGLECTIIGPKLKFHTDTIVALTGATSNAKLDGESVSFYKPISIKAGQTLDIGKSETGCRTYLAVRNGIDVPVYLGSRSTFAMGQFGGHGGRPLKVADILPISQPEIEACTTPAPIHEPTAASPEIIPTYGKVWEIGVLYGPHGAPDFFQEEYIDTFFSADWEVHYNSNRLGVRLVGPKPLWTRTNGGEAGLHPSNIHDSEYAIGTINFTGDMPVILAQDGPSLGGFVCPATIVKAEIWKIGQLKPGDTIRFKRISFETALDLELALDETIEKLKPIAKVIETPIKVIGNTVSECVLFSSEANENNPEVAYRQAGDKYILIEYGPNVLDFKLRFRVHALMEALAKDPIEGIIELSPGVRSLQIHFDGRQITQTQLVKTLVTIEAGLPPVEQMVVPSRIVHMPLAYEDKATLESVDHYRQSVRDKAPWLPSNIEFIRRMNGLKSKNDVRDVVFDTSYIILGLGDVYLGAPCGVPVDPRHRLITSKYNPARTFTVEGTVGIGGVYMCIYPMQGSPGGYQIVGRTLPVWNRFLQNKSFKDEKPWLLRFFDQIRYYPVTEDELLEMRKGFQQGKTVVRIEETTFDLGAYDKWLKENEESINAFKAKQKIAFDQEVEYWKQEGFNKLTEDDVKPVKTEEYTIPEDLEGVYSLINGSVWKILVTSGQEVKKEDPLFILEAMKMEFTINSEFDGVISEIRCTQGNQVDAGDLLITISVAAPEYIIS